MVTIPPARFGQLSVGNSMRNPSMVLYSHLRQPLQLESPSSLWTGNGLGDFVTIRYYTYIYCQKGTVSPNMFVKTIRLQIDMTC